MKCIVSSMKMRVRVFYVLLYLSAADPSRGLSVRSTWSLQIGTRVPVCSYMHTFVIDPPPPSHIIPSMPALLSSSFALVGGGCLDARWKVGGGGTEQRQSWHFGTSAKFLLSASM